MNHVLMNNSDLIRQQVRATTFLYLQSRRIPWCHQQLLDLQTARILHVSLIPITRLCSSDDSNKNFYPVFISFATLVLVFFWFCLFVLTASLFCLLTNDIRLFSKLLCPNKTPQDVQLWENIPLQSVNYLLT